MNLTARGIALIVSFVILAPAASAGSLEEDLELHDQGGTATITSEGDAPITYTVQLEQRVYTGSRSVPVLKLAVFEEGKEESVAYSWAEPSAANIGMNLRWFQAGCTAAE